MGSFRLPARTALAAILASLALFTTAVAAQAKGAVTLTVHAGYQDVIKPGEWMPVTIDASNSGAEVDGTLQVQQSLNAQPGVSGTTIYQNRSASPPAPASGFGFTWSKTRPAPPSRPASCRTAGSWFTRILLATGRRPA